MTDKTRAGRRGADTGASQTLRNPTGGSEPLQVVVSRLTGVKRTGTGWKARCPAHNDKTPSLSISTNDRGDVLLHCHAECSIEAITDAIGLTPRDLFADNGRVPSKPGRRRATKRNSRTWPSIDAYAEAHSKYGTLSAHWTYRTADGAVSFHVLRFDGPDGKTFRPLHPTTAGLAEGDPPGKLPLYRLPELLMRPNETVWVPEGEKCADLPNQIGLCGTTSAHGSQSMGKSDWSPLAGRNVVIIPDNDEPGRKYAKGVANILTKLDPPATVRIVSLPGLSDGEDIVQWAERLSECADAAGLLCELADKADVSGRHGIEVQAASDIQTRPINWLWEGHLACGSLNALGGNPSEGKSILSLELSAIKSRGGTWPDESPCEPGDTVICNAEDAADQVIVPRLKAAGAVLSRIHIIRSAVNLASDVKPLETIIKQRRAKFLIVDPLSAFLPLEVDTNRDAAVRGVLAQLQAMAERTGVCVLMIMHLNKKSGEAAIYRMGGSIGFIAAPRVVWIMGRDPENEATRVAVLAKHNICTAPLPLRFTIEGPPARVVWDTTWHPPIDADRLLGGTPTGRIGKKRDRARAWLCRYLAEHGPTLRETILESGEGLGFGERLLERAGADAGIVSERRPAVWRLSDKGG